MSSKTIKTNQYPGSNLLSVDCDGVGGAVADCVVGGDGNRKARALVRYVPGASRTRGSRTY